MTRYAALLRGVNVAGRRMSMAELRMVLTGLGLGDVRTYLQSGQAVFDDSRDGDRLAAELTRALTGHFGFETDVIVRDHGFLRKIVDACPFVAADVAARQLHCTFFSRPVDESRYADIDRADYLPEKFQLGDRVLYLLAPNGIGRSKLAERLSRRRLEDDLIGTSRNWNTVVKLMELTA
ncbi:DUF1697 domain-containing protein [Nocardia albiluteola]|uniref:DUF1697 domain-containing protein n=1 Tax=Nocardia albiluteola TaxID=2842303 RepID=UPI001C07493F|nr:DUF1697 domain-containing protein [Nocardia albiluteola]